MLEIVEKVVRVYVNDTKAKELSLVQLNDGMHQRCVSFGESA